MQFEEQIVQSIRKLQTDKQMKQSQLAELSGMSESTIAVSSTKGAAYTAMILLISQAHYR